MKHTAPINTEPIKRAAIVGYGYVGRATEHALKPVCDVAWHDPAVAASRDLVDAVTGADIVFVCVPTPTTASGAADLGCVLDVAEQLASLRLGTPLVIRSTVPPGTTEDLARRWACVPWAFCPEFLREQHCLQDAATPSRVVLGWSCSIGESHRARIRELFARRFPNFPVVELPSTEAELLKYAANALFGVKVTFANEMADLADQLGVRWEPVRAALVLDRRVGDGHLAVPGPDGKRGFGGSCLPKDMAALLRVAAERGVALDVVEAAIRANTRRRS